jgi:hypothetical protein
MLQVVLTIVLLVHGHPQLTRHDTRLVFMNWQDATCERAARLTAQRARKRLKSRGTVRAECEVLDQFPI